MLRTVRTLPFSSPSSRSLRAVVATLLSRKKVWPILGVALAATLGFTGAARAHLGHGRAALDETFTFSPTSGSHFSSSSLEVTTSICDDSYGIASVSGSVNGHGVDFNDGLIASCGGDPGNDKGTMDLTLTPGENDVEVESCNMNSDCSFGFATYYLDVPAMTVEAGVHTLPFPLPSDTVEFFVYNSGGVTDNVNWSVSCTGGVSCSGGSSYSLSTGTWHETTITVSGSSAGTGKITFTASYATYPGVGGSDTTHLVAETPNPTVTAPSSPQSENPGTNVTLKFPVSVGAYGAGTYTYTPSCGTFASCSISPSAPRSLGASSTDTAFVSFHIPYLTANQDIPVGVTVSGPSSATGNASTTVDVGAIPVSTVFVGFDAPSVDIGQGTTAHATVIYADGSTLPNAPASWSSGNTGIATVNSGNGNVTGAGAGSTSITATAGGFNGSATIPVTTPPSVGLEVTMQRLNAEGSVARDACLTIAAGDDAAYECGDLRLVHPLPSVKTMNESRAPMLIYTSRHSRPLALVAANVTGFSVSPSSLTATLKIGGHTLTQSFAWNSSCNSATCRIVIPVLADSLTLATGWYADTLQVSVTSGGTPYTATDIGSVAIVNRVASPFGAGWWLDGLEQLVMPADTTKKFWVAGDGSTRLYVQTAVDSVFTPQTVVDRPDTLMRVGSNWRRHLRNGAYVEFDGGGNHIRTVNRERDTTRFAYSGGVLDSIVLPTPSGTKPAYTFSYVSVGGGDSVLTSVSSPGASGARTTAVSHSTNSRITQIEDPDGTSVYFTWDIKNRITRRKNRLNDSTTYTYDAAGGISQVSIDMSRTGDSAIVSTFCAAETRALDSCPSTGGGTVSVLPLSSVTTYYDGPRTDTVDVTTFFINRFGAPDTVIDAHGGHTHVHRSLMFPALADSATDPTNFARNAIYTIRGLLQASTAVAPFGAGNATTRYTYDDTWDQLTSVTAPTGDASYFNYDPTTGNRLWQQTGTGDTTRVYFGYNARKQVDSVRAPLRGRAEYISYDATLGNDSTVTTPNAYPTSTARNAIGAPVTVTSPTDAGLTRFTVQHLLYDVMGRLQVDSTISAAFTSTVDPGTAIDSTPSLARVVRDSLDAEGMLLVSTRYTVPEVAPPDGTMHSVFSYDAAHRRRTSAEDFARHDSTWYDQAGNVVRTWSNRGKTITQTYDALNRLLVRTIPGDSVAPELCVSCENNGSNPYGHFPYFLTVLPGPSTDTNVVVLADVDSFSYDAAGRMRSAINHDARVWRSYFANGQVHAEVDSLRAYDPGATTANWTSHVYSLTYAYDSSGRRISRADTVAGSSIGTQSYHYNVLGMLDSTTGIDGTHHSLQYDAAGRLTHRTSGKAWETLTYDWDDHLSTRQNPKFGDAFTYDARGKMTQAVSQPTYWGVDSSTMAYDGFGALVLDTRIPTVGNTSTDEFKVDGFGNVVRHDLNRGYSDGRSATINSFSAGRMTGTIADTLPGVKDPENETLPLIKTYTEMYAMFDSVGNQTQTNLSVSTWQTNQYEQASSGQSWLRNYYNGADQLKMSERHAYFTRSSTIYRRTTQQEYFYDALGRRVALRTQRDSSCLYGDGAQWTDQCVQSMDRFIWDGADLVTELREYGGWDVEGYLNYNGSSGVVQYTNAPGVLGQDVPLAVSQNGGSTFVPWPTWHGTFENGTFVDSTDMNLYSWPARTNGLYFSPDERITPIDPNGWWGSLIEGKADANGLLYDRNRYYSPESGQFTQIDPIGLGGGMNLYGYAAGDPVNSSDPFGLCPIPADDCPSGFFATVSGAIGAVVGGITGGGAGLVVAAPTGELAAPLTVPALSAAGAAEGAATGAMVGAAIDNIVVGSVNQMNKEIRTGKAPRGVERADKGKVTGEQDHVHLKDGSAINQDGTWKHEGSTITNAIRDWLSSWGWKAP